MELIYRTTYGPLPTSKFTLHDAGAEVGFLQIRHRPSHAVDVPAAFASHIYYEVLERYRCRGYGTKLLELGKHQAKRLGLTEIIINCWKSNPASKRIIEKNGGRPEGEWPDGEGNCLYRYRISLS